MLQVEVEARCCNGGRSTAVEGIEIVKEGVKVEVQRWKGL